jgi:hypothetical protein
LILKCWPLNPSDRPSFDGILAEFEKAQFRIVPGADCEAFQAELQIKIEKIATARELFD